ncbi:hypothetical protein AMTR_s00033p00022640 [Amborella trichopoda]|uniref:Uncharacterized protein n=1 Tax=Amborella trichopoda TaxID=13333 RepID=U5D1D5_AMBTC|nr:hypothetical protein AMTR_s00033p00022640 [Amborella trichopoda]
MEKVGMKRFRRLFWMTRSISNRQIGNCVSSNKQVSSEGISKSHVLRGTEQVDIGKELALSMGEVTTMDTKRERQLFLWSEKMWDVNGCGYGRLKKTNQSNRL